MGVDGDYREGDSNGEDELLRGHVDDATDAILRDEIKLCSQYYTCAEGDPADEAAETSTPHGLIPKHIQKKVPKFTPRGKQIPKKQVPQNHPPEATKYQICRHVFCGLATS